MDSRFAEIAEHLAEWQLTQLQQFEDVKDRMEEVGLFVPVIDAVVTAACGGVRAAPVFDRQATRFQGFPGFTRENSSYHRFVDRVCSLTRSQLRKCQLRLVANRRTAASGARVLLDRTSPAKPPRMIHWIFDGSFITDDRQNYVITVRIDACLDVFRIELAHCCQRSAMPSMAVWDALEFASPQQLPSAMWNTSIFPGIQILDHLVRRRFTTFM